VKHNKDWRNNGLSLDNIDNCGPAGVASIRSCIFLLDH